MAYTVPIFSFNGTATTIDAYHAFANCDSRANQATEANVNMPWFSSGTISYLTVTVTANAAASTNTCYLRKNGANGNQSVAIGAGLTGVFTDVSNQDVWANGDVINCFFDRTGSSVTIAAIGAHVTRTSDLVVKHAAVGAVTWGNNNSTRFIPLSGDAGYSSIIGITETAQVKFPTDMSGTIAKTSIYVSANARPNVVTCMLRKNSTDQQSISIPAGLTGLFTTANVDKAFSSGDTLNYYILLGSGGGNFTSQWVSCEMKSTVGEMMAYSSGVLTVAGVNNGVTRYASLFGTLIASGSSTGSKVKMRCSGTVSKLRVYCSTNGGTTNCVCTIRKNGVDQAVTATITAATTGEFADINNSFTFVSGDELDIKFTRAAGSGTTYIMRVGCLIQVNNSFTPTVRYY